MGPLAQKFWLGPVILLGLIAFAIGIWLQTGSQPSASPLSLQAATVLSQPRAIRPFQLTQHDGQSFTQADLKGHWSLMFFGFTSCPYVCPSIITELNRTHQALASLGVKQPRFMMVSIDPDRDSTDRMREYVTSFNQDFIGLRGDADQIQKMTRELGIVYMKVMDQDDTTNYDIDHSGTLLLFNPDGRLHALFSMPHQSALIAQDLAQLTQHASIA